MRSGGETGQPATIWIIQQEVVTNARRLSPAGNRAHFWGGWGGSLVVVDQTERLCVSYVRNKMGLGTVGDDRGIGVVAAAYAALA